MNTDQVQQNIGKEVVSLDNFEKQVKALTDKAIDYFPNTADSILEKVQKAKTYKFDSNNITKEDYNTIYEMWSILRNIRLESTRVGKRLRDWSNAYNKKIKAHEDSLNSLVEGEEERLYNLRITYEAKIEEEKRLKEEEQKRILQERVEALAKVNYAMDIDMLKEMDQTTFDEMLHNITVDYELKQREESDRLAMEIEADKRRMEELEAENKRLREIALAAGRNIAPNIPQEAKQYPVTPNEAFGKESSDTPPPASEQTINTANDLARKEFFEYLDRIKIIVERYPNLAGTKYEQHIKNVHDKISAFLQNYLAKK